MTNPLAALPKMDRLLEHPAVALARASVGHGLTVDLCRRALDEAREAIRGGAPPPTIDALADTVSLWASPQESGRLAKVVNATGVVLHTNLGRAPLGRAPLEALADALSGYTNLEFDLGAGKRAKRAVFVSGLAARVAGTERAVIVNNNAGAVFLILATFAAGKRVVISRGELVQIGGGFRIPDILRASGGTLHEVGTTNITRVADYERAIDDEVGMLLKVHQSNFAMEGFTERPSVADLAPLKGAGRLLVSDLGSGFVAHSGGLRLDEPSPAEHLADGADLVCFSGDKLLGGPQCGIIAGRADLVDRIATHPLLRILRPDKVTFFLLEQCLVLHTSGRGHELPAVGMLTATQEELRARVARFLATYPTIGAVATPLDTDSTSGGGSLPGVTFPGAGFTVPVRHAKAAAMRLRGATPAVVCTIHDGALVFDLRAVFSDDEPHLARAIAAVIREDAS